MQDIDLLAIKPFEICSIRPPTENYSLTFRLTRNCYWNKCRFCPVYKLGARFSKRTLDEVKEDIERAKKIDDLLIEWNIIDPYFFNRSDSRFMDLINEIKEAHREAGFADSDAREKQPEISEEIDPRMAWFLSWFRDKPAIEDSLNHVLTWRTGGARTCFFGDGDSLILKPDFFAEVTGHVKKNFPSLERFTVYGRTKSAAKLRTLSELQDFKKLLKPQPDYLERVYIHTMRGKADGETSVTLQNRKLGVALSIRFNIKQLPYLIQWKMLGQGEYVLGLEPSNIPLKDRKQLKEENILPLLQPGESVKNDIEIVLTDL